MSAISEALQRARHESGLSQEKLATLSDYDKSFISRLESAERSPSRETIIILADAMNLTPLETDQLLVHAGYTPVQVGVLLNFPILADLDEWLVFTGSMEKVQQVMDFVQSVLPEGYHAAAV